MKTKLLALALGLSVSLSAYADPVISLPAGPLFIKFTGAEQIATNGATTAFGVSALNPLGTDLSNVGEISWGVFAIDTIRKGVIDQPNEQISPTGPAFFSDGGAAHNAQVTGMFYGIKQGAPATATNPLPGTSGFMDLYWRDLDTTTYSDVGTSSPTVRTGTSTATGFTEGTLLAHIKFVAGIDPLNAAVTVSGTVIPTQAGFSGVADFFADVDTSVLGAWTTQLATNYFNTAFGGADLKFKNSYNLKTSWNGSNPNIVGARLDDPAQAFAIPEPGILSLMGLAMLGMAVARRRRND